MEQEEEFRDILNKRNQQLLEQRQLKIRQYEAFINDKLKVDLKNVLDQRDVVYQETAEYLELRNNVLTFKGEEGKMKTKMNLGHEFFVEATIQETNRIMVEVGLGFIVEFTLDEALEFINRKEEQLNQKSKKLSDLAMEIKAQIKMMLHGLQQLADLS